MPYDMALFCDGDQLLGLGIELLSEGNEAQPAGHEGLQCFWYSAHQRALMQSTSPKDSLKTK